MIQTPPDPWRESSHVKFKIDKRMTPVSSVTRTCVKPPHQFSLARPHDDPRGVVYYIADPDRTFVKIGTTTNLNQRLKQLRLDRGTELDLWTYEPGSYTLEMYRHCEFYVDRIDGEWFAVSRRLKRHIEMVERRYGSLK